jgi:hypothetical protein
MLKNYTKLEDVPEALRGEYKLHNGLYIPDIADDHPINVENRTLTTAKQAAEAKAVNLQADVVAAKADAEAAKHANTIPRGHRAVPNADVELLEKYRPLGTPDELTAKVTEHKTFKEQVDKQTRENNLRLVAKELGYDNVDAFIRLPNLPDFEIRDKDGKKTVIAKVKDGETVTEKPAAEFMESSTDHAPFLGALKTATGVTVHGSSSTTASGGKDPFEWAREFGKNWNESRPQTDVAAAFGITK